MPQINTVDDVNTALGALCSNIPSGPVLNYEYDDATQMYRLSPEITFRTGTGLVDSHYLQHKFELLDIKEDVNSVKLKNDITTLLQADGINITSTYLNNPDDLRFLEDIIIRDLMRVSLVSSDLSDTDISSEEPQHTNSDDTRPQALRRKLFMTTFYKTKTSIHSGRLFHLLLDSVTNSRNPERFVAPLIKACTDVFYFNELKRYVISRLPSCGQEIPMNAPMQTFLSSVGSSIFCKPLERFQTEYLPLTAPVVMKDVVNKNSTKSEQVKKLFTLLREEVEIREKYKNEYGPAFLDIFYHYPSTALAVNSLRTIADSNHLEGPAQEKVKHMTEDVEFPSLKAQLENPSLSLQYVDDLLSAGPDVCFHGYQDDTPEELHEIVEAIAQKLKISHEKTARLTKPQYMFVKNNPGLPISEEVERQVEKGVLKFPRKAVLKDKNSMEGSESDDTRSKKSTGGNKNRSGPLNGRPNGGAPKNSTNRNQQTPLRHLGTVSSVFGFTGPVMPSGDSRHFNPGPSRPGSSRNKPPPFRNNNPNPASYTHPYNTVQPMDPGTPLSAMAGPSRPPPQQPSYMDLPRGPKNGVMNNSARNNGRKKKPQVKSSRSSDSGT